MPTASRLFGVALNRLRRSSPEGAISTNEFATRLGIGGSTLRMLEAGSLVPSISLGYAMSKVFDLNLSSTFLILSVVNVVDMHQSTEGRKTVAEAMCFQEPRLSFFLLAVIDVLKAPVGPRSSRRRSLEHEGVISAMIAFMRQPYGTVERMDMPGVLTEAARNISPLLLDGLAQFATSLSAFQTYLNLDALSKWERTVADRIARVWSYHKDPTILVETFGSANWDFLFNSLAVRPKFIVISPGNGQAISKFLKLLAKRYPNRDLSDLVQAISSIPSEVSAQLSRCLWYDTKNAQLGLDQPDVSIGVFAKNPNQYKAFHNLLVYEVTAGYTAAGSTFCGFVDDAVPSNVENSTQARDRTSRESFARALSSPETAAVLEQLRDAYSISLNSALS